MPKRTINQPDDLGIREGHSPRRKSSISWILPVAIGLVIGFQLGLIVGNRHLDVASYDSAVERNTKSYREKAIVPSSTGTTTDSLGSLSLPTGWNQLFVYAGGMDLLLDREDYTRDFTKHSPKKPSWSGQISQDALVYRLLGEKRGGFFVELAANDAVYLSNSFALEQYYGWRGICIEGNPTYWFPLSFRNCKVVGAMTGRSKGEELKVDFTGFETGGIVGHKDVNMDMASHSKIEQRRTTTLAEILDMFNAPNNIDFLSLDVEGAEQYIMQDFPFDRYTFSVMTIECPSPGLHTLLAQHGYQKIKTIASFGETLWKHKSVTWEQQDTVLEDWCTNTNPSKCS